MRSREGERKGEDGGKGRREETTKQGERYEKTRECGKKRRPWRRREDRENEKERDRQTVKAKETKRHSGREGEPETETNGKKWMTRRKGEKERRRKRHRQTNKEIVWNGKTINKTNAM